MRRERISTLNEKFCVLMYVYLCVSFETLCCMSVPRGPDTTCRSLKQFPLPSYKFWMGTTMHISTKGVINNHIMEKHQEILNFLHWISLPKKKSISVLCISPNTCWPIESATSSSRYGIELNNLISGFLKGEQKKKTTIFFFHIRHSFCSRMQTRTHRNLNLLNFFILVVRQFERQSRIQFS